MKEIFFCPDDQADLTPQQNRFFTPEGGDFYVHESMFDGFGAEEKTINVECFIEGGENYAPLNQIIASCQLTDREQRQAVKLRGALFRLYERTRTKKGEKNGTRF